MRITTAARRFAIFALLRRLTILEIGNDKMKFKKYDIIQLLNQLNINYEWKEHEAIYTVKDGKKLNLPHLESIAKNLFICDDKKQDYFLISVPKEKQVDLKDLRVKLQSRRLSFASEHDLETILNIPKGAVTPFGILNDNEHKVTIIIDKAFYPGLIGVPLNENTATVWLTAKDLFQVITQHENKVEWLSL